MRGACNHPMPYLDHFSLGWSAQAVEIYLAFVKDGRNPSVSNISTSRLMTGVTMLRRIALVLTFALVLAVTGPAAIAEEEEGSFERHKYSNDAGAREYMLYVPSQLQQDAPLIVYLHGCTQTADVAALAEPFNELAEQRGFLVAYPEQDPNANGSRCWNWFLPDHQQRGGGEPSIIAGITNRVIANYGADPSRTYVYGVSAGAAMAAIMGATYPDLYAAIGFLAAPSYTGADPTGDRAYEAMAEHARPVPAIIFQGTADALVNYPLGRTALYQWLGTNDLADDGERNGSISTDPAENRAFNQTPTPGSGDPCIPPPSGFPCAGGVVGFQEQYPHTIERFRDSQKAVMVEFWTIHGLGHAIPNGNRAGSFTDPLGPDIQTAAVEFFMAHPMPTPHEF